MFSNYLLSFLQTKIHIAQAQLSLGGKQSYRWIHEMKVLATQSCPTLWPHGPVAHQASLSMEFSRQEYWSAMPSSGGSQYEYLILPSLFSEHPVLEMSVWVLSKSKNKRQFDIQVIYWWKFLWMIKRRRNSRRKEYSDHRVSLTSKRSARKGIWRGSGGMSH